MRDTAARHYLHETGRSWVPATGNRISLGTTAAIVDGRAYLQARRERVRDANMVHGTPVVFASDDEAKQFADNLLRTLKAVRERVGDMYLVHGGDMNLTLPIQITANAATYRFHKLLTESPHLQTEKTHFCDSSVCACTDTSMLARSHTP